MSLLSARSISLDSRTFNGGLGQNYTRFLICSGPAATVGDAREFPVLLRGPAQADQAGGALHPRHQPGGAGGRGGRVNHRWGGAGQRRIISHPVSPNTPMGKSGSVKIVKAFFLVAKHNNVLFLLLLHIGTGIVSELVSFWTLISLSRIVSE